MCTGIFSLGSSCSEEDKQGVSAKQETVKLKMLDKDSVSLIY